MYRGAWRAIVHGNHKELDMTEKTTYTHTHIYVHVVSRRGKNMYVYICEVLSTRWLGAKGEGCLGVLMLKRGNNHPSTGRQEDLREAGLWWGL